MGVPYHLIWLNPNPKKKELYIQFITEAKGRKNQIPTYKDGNLHTSEGIWDHLSFHSDGNVHIRTKYKNGKKKEYIHKKKMEQSIYDFSANSCVPILSSTYNIFNNEKQFKIMDQKELKNNSHLWHTDKPMLFTMLVFIANHHNYDDFYNEYIKTVLGIRSKPLMVDMGDKFHCLLILLTSKVTVEFKNGYIEDQIIRIDKENHNLPFVSHGILPPYDYLVNGLVDQ